MVDLEEKLEAAYWRYDALHRAHYRDAEPSLPGPMAERDAFKCVLRAELTALSAKAAAGAKLRSRLVFSEDVKVVDACRRYDSEVGE